jgi:hemophore-related protein
VEFSTILKLALTLIATSGVALIGPSTGVAGAQPLDPVISTACNYDQIVAALRVEAPELAGALDANPEAQAKLRALVALSPDQRRERIDQRLDANPQWRTTLEQKRATAQGQEKEMMLLRVADTCGNF